MNLRQRLPLWPKKFFKKKFLLIKNNLRRIAFIFFPSYTVPIKYTVLSSCQKNSELIGQIELIKNEKYKYNINSERISNENLFKIYDAKVFSKHGIIKSQKYLIVHDEHKLDSLKYKKDIYNAVYDFKVPLMEFGKTKHLESAIILIGHGPNNYYHWFFDLILKLKYVENNNLKIKDVVVQEPKMNFQIETIEKIQNRYNFHFLNKKSKYKINNAIFSKFNLKNNELAVDSIENINFLKEILFSKKLMNLDNEFIYIAREKTTNGRNIINQDELYDYLITKRFVIVRLEKHHLDEQLNIFSKAKIIIAPHGAGLTNLITAQQGTHLIELLHVNRPSNLFERLALTLGIKYSSLVDSSPNKSHDPNIFVDLIHLDDILRPLLK